MIDTNVLLSGLLWRGAPHALIEHLQAGTLSMFCALAFPSVVYLRLYYRARELEVDEPLSRNR